MCSRIAVVVQHTQHVTTSSVAVGSSGQLAVFQESPQQLRCVKHILDATPPTKVVIFAPLPSPPSGRSRSDWGCFALSGLQVGSLQSLQHLHVCF